MIVSPAHTAVDQQSGLPGYTLPLDYLPPPINGRARGDGYADYPLFEHALQFPMGYAVVQREILMMRVMNTITDKPDWDRKIFDEEIVSKWRNEISQSGQDITPNMMDFIIKEVQWKAGLLKTEPFTTVFDMGVVKSDIAIPEDLRKALVDAVAPLEDIPADKRDYHPGSDEKVIDLVHPSLFPLVYGRTRILPDQVIKLEDCLGTTGQGEVVPVQTIEKGLNSRSWGRAPELYSTKFQWLPCDVKLGSTETEKSCQIVSYINNLHPEKHRDLYGVIEKVIARAIPMWNKTLTHDIRRPARIEYKRVEYEDDPSNPEPEQGPEENDDDYGERLDAWNSTQPIKRPEPNPFRQYIPDVRAQREQINLYKLFGETGLQVIVKLANIELTPEKPEYGGGTWHIEGQMNERICATAIYYYSSENITESSLAFRHRMDDRAFDDVSYEQDRHEFLQAVYGMPPETQNWSNGPMTQHLGSVVSREGRLLTFPNILQHCVSPFSLADRSKPGHRKILALFLVDPHLRIISTANIPPQQEEWGKEKRDLVHGLLSGKFPAELQQMVSKEGISGQMMSMEEAKEFREELMAERSVNAPAQNEAFELGEFSLCEH